MSIGFPSFTNYLHFQGYEKEAYEQLCGYLSRKRADAGYMLTFDFRKAGSKTTKAQWVEVNGKRIFDVVV